MKFRRGESNDFSFISTLCDSEETDIIFRVFTKENQNEDAEEFSICKEDIDFFDEYYTITYEEFLSMISKPRVNKVYIILDGKNPVGFIYLEKVRKKRWRIDRFHMLYEFQTKENIIKAIEWTQKHHKFKWLQIWSGSDCELLENLGFEEIENSMFCWTRKLKDTN